MQVIEERMIRSRSPKRYSLNRKIKEKELRYVALDLRFIMDRKKQVE